VSAVSPNRRPARLTGGLAVGLSLAAVGLFATGLVVLALGVEAAGLGVLAVGFWVGRTRSRPAGVAVGLIGLALVVAALALAWAGSGDLLTGLQVTPGLLGALVVGLGVVPVRGVGSRWLVKIGTGLVLVAVFAAGVVGEPGLTTLLLGVAATVLAWDAGEHAIGIGAQLGRRASTWRIELSHVAASALVGGIAVAAGHVVSDLGSPTLDLGSFVVLLMGLLALTAALYD